LIKRIISDLDDSKNFEEKRAERLRELDERLRQLTIAIRNAQTEQAELDAEASRIEQDRLSPGECQDCLLLDGIHRNMTSLPRTDDQPPPRTDRFRCGACGFEELREF
jgi:hypothetical protein